MKKVKVKASEPLFNKWNQIAERVRKIEKLIKSSCSTLVQNDMEVEIEDLIEWKGKIIPLILEELDLRKEEINKLVDITLGYIKKINKENI